MLELRSKTIAFSSALKRKEIDRVKQLESEITNLDRSDPLGNFELIREKQGELNNIREKRLEGSMVRARAKWIEEGEKPSSYFCNLENRNFVSKRMVSLIKSNNEEITDFNCISKEVGDFYKKLYCSREESIVDVNLKNVLSDNTPHSMAERGFNEKKFTKLKLDFFHLIKVLATHFGHF